jgi:hypothetical protein
MLLFVNPISIIYGYLWNYLLYECCHTTNQQRQNSAACEKVATIKSFRKETDTTDFYNCFYCHCHFKEKLTASHYT